MLIQRFANRAGHDDFTVNIGNNEYFFYLNIVGDWISDVPAGADYDRLVEISEAYQPYTGPADPADIHTRVEILEAGGVGGSADLAALQAEIDAAEANIATLQSAGATDAELATAEANAAAARTALATAQSTVDSDQNTEIAQNTAARHESGDRWQGGKDYDATNNKFIVIPTQSTAVDIDGIPYAQGKPHLKRYRTVPYTSNNTLTLAELALMEDADTKRVLDTEDFVNGSPTEGLPGQISPRKFREFSDLLSEFETPDDGDLLELYGNYQSNPDGNTIEIFAPVLNATDHPTDPHHDGIVFQLFNNGEGEASEIEVKSDPPNGIYNKTTDAFDASLILKAGEMAIFVSRPTPAGTNLHWVPRVISDTAGVDGASQQTALEYMSLSALGVGGNAVEDTNGQFNIGDLASSANYRVTDPFGLLNITNHSITAPRDGDVRITFSGRGETGATGNTAFQILIDGVVVSTGSTDATGDAFHPFVPSAYLGPISEGQEVTFTTEVTTISSVHDFNITFQMQPTTESVLVGSVVPQNLEDVIANTATLADGATGTLNNNLTWQDIQNEYDEIIATIVYEQNSYYARWKTDQLFDATAALAVSVGANGWAQIEGITPAGSTFTHDTNGFSATGDVTLYGVKSQKTVIDSDDLPTEAAANLSVGDMLLWDGAKLTPATLVTESTLATAAATINQLTGETTWVVTTDTNPATGAIHLTECEYFQIGNRRIYNVLFLIDTDDAITFEVPGGQILTASMSGGYSIGGTVFEMPGNEFRKHAGENFITINRDDDNDRDNQISGTFEVWME